MSINALIEQLKENNEDFELYPTTKDMIYPIFHHYKSHYREISTILDIGCGTCNFLNYMKEFYEKDDSISTFFKYQVMEKSKILINQLPKETIVLGTDFHQNTLLDKNVDAIFCNPPYSEYEDWTQRILNESNSKYIYMIIPERWIDNNDIMEIIKNKNIRYEILGCFDFLHSERIARAKVNVILFNLSYTPKNKSFSDWFDKTFKMRNKDQKQKFDFEIEKQEKEEVKNQLVGGKNKVEILVNSYDYKLKTLYDHFKAITSLDVDILESIGVTKNSVMESLKSKIIGLKNIYWKVVFDELEEITSRLTSATKEKLYKHFQELLTVDFTPENIYSLVTWVCKNSSAYYDEQLIELYKTFTTPENIIKYKSNQKVFQRDNWGRFDNDMTHYCLSYRIICDRLYFKNSYSYYIEIDKLHSQTIINDLCVIANNLGFVATKRDYPEKFGEKYYIWLDDKTPLLEYKIYINGNTHIKLNKEFAKAMNVEVSRLLGWIRDKSDISKEFPDEMAKGAEKYFKSSYNIGIINSNIKLLSK